MQQVLTEEVQDGRHSLFAVITPVDSGLNIFLGGGERPHLGTVVIALPRASLTGDGSKSCTTSVYNFLGHKDDGLAVPLAEQLCKKTGLTVVVTAGIHIDGADALDIHRFQENLEILAEKILAKIVAAG